jgi:hypothetical protein
MGKPHYELSKITGKKYDIFSQIRILNIQQVIFYLQNGVYFNDIELSKDRKTGLPVMVFLFTKDDTKAAYAEWIERKNQIFEKE